VPWAYEVPLPVPGDLRAWDAVARVQRGGVAIEAETRLSDIQALQRRLTLKQRDDAGVGCVVLAIAATRHNRAVVRANLDALRASFPLDREAIVAALVAGRVPAANGMIVV